MARAAAAQHRTASSNEPTNLETSQEDLEKLQEIHELINLMFAELTARPPQSAAAAYVTTALAPPPYSQSLLQHLWGASPYTRPPGF